MTEKFHEIEDRDYASFASFRLPEIRPTVVAISPLLFSISFRLISATYPARIEATRHVSGRRFAP